MGKELEKVRELVERVNGALDKANEAANELIRVSNDGHRMTPEHDAIFIVINTLGGAMSMLITGSRVQLESTKEGSTGEILEKLRPMSENC